MITDAFTKAIDEKDILGLRIMMKDSLLIDPSFKEFDEMEKLVKNIDGMYDKHDGRELIKDKSKWDEDYLDLEMVRLIDNFSHERIDLVKNMVRHHYPQYSKQSNAEEKAKEIKDKAQKIQQESIIKRILEGIKAFGRLFIKALAYIKNGLISVKNGIIKAVQNIDRKRIDQGFRNLNDKDISLVMSNYIETEYLVRTFGRDAFKTIEEDFNKDIDSILSHSEIRDDYIDWLNLGISDINSDSRRANMFYRYFRILGESMHDRSVYNDCFDGFRLKDTNKLMKIIFDKLLKQDIKRNCVYSFDLVTDTENLLKHFGMDYEDIGKVMNKYIDELDKVGDRIKTKYNSIKNKYGELSNDHISLINTIFKNTSDLIATNLTLASKILGIYSNYKINATAKISKKLLELANLAYKNPDSIEKNAEYVIDIEIPYANSMNESSIFDFDFYTAGNIFQEVAFI